MNILHRIIGSRNDRLLRRYGFQVEWINTLEEKLHSLPGEALVQKTQSLKNRIRDGEEILKVLPEAFALVKTACRRLLGKKWLVCDLEMIWDMIPYDEQLMGGIALAEGKIAEMFTGEGKTLVATLPLFLYALSGRGVHLATANDYLALRDSQWMGRVFDSLGLRVGCIQSGMGLEERKKAYSADVTYGAGKEFGFDYLRDHSSAHSVDELVQRGHYYCIVDEVDSILIDEARTPLIISGAPMQDNGVYKDLRPVIEKLIQEQKEICERLLKELDPGKAAQFRVENEGVKLFLISKADPRSPKFLKWMQDFKMMQLVRDAEIYLMRDILKRKRIKQTLNENLFYVLEYKDKHCYLTEKAMAYLNERENSPFVLPDVTNEIASIEEDEEITEIQKHQKKEEVLSRYESQREKIHALNNLLKAYTVFDRDVDYCIINREIMLLDAFTGRLMEGRRFTEGLHQALEAKEGLDISPETHTIATVSTQNYFRLYEEIAGMTGTAYTSATEFKDIYELEVVRVPTHKPICRADKPDVFFRRESEKIASILNEIESVHQTGRPILIGTVTVEKSESLSDRLKVLGIPHQVLNARYHQEEARIISRAGKKGAVTIATNMAGRGTDIKIEPGIEEGLHVIGTERHESKRIDNQLRGRSGRQGDRGTSEFFVSLEDDLLKKFGIGKLVKAMKFLTLPVFRNVARPFLEKLIDFAQENVEMRNFGTRRTLLEFDDVVDVQRRIVYEIRERLLKEKDSSKVIADFLRQFDPEEEWEQVYEEGKKKSDYSLAMIERLAFLGSLDQFWIQHLSDLERLRDGIGFRSFAQTSVIAEFRRESFKMFSALMKEICQRIKKAVLS